MFALHTFSYRSRATVVVFFSLLLLRCSTPGSQLAEQLPPSIDYNFHIRPILSDKCFACHGPDAAAREAGLRLDVAEEALGELPETPGKHAIVPGKPAASELWQRIHATDEAVVMPPPESQLALTAREKALLQAWIEQGAQYKPHWAFMTPQKTALPKLRQNDWPQNEIDHFILHQLEQQGLSPSPPAEPEDLLRRASFSLTGLPPSPESMDAYLQNQAPEAYTHLLDSLLALPAYGERMAAHWLDVARYADSDGYLDDKHRDFSPWRDWVIKAFNQNMPYDQFVSWQLAGDLMPAASQAQTLATAFNRLHKKNSEAGIVFEEFRVNYVADRTNTFGKAFMAISLECAQCHDHKYDPVSQKDYYKLFGFFNSTFELGTAVYGPDQTPGPALMLSSEEEAQTLAFLQQQMKRASVELEEREQKSLKEIDAWLENTPIDLAWIKQEVDQSRTSHITFDELRWKDANASTPDLAQPGKVANLNQPEIGEGIKGKAFYVTDYNSGGLPENVGWYERTEPFSVSLWLRPDTLYEDVGIFTHCEDYRLGYKGYSLHLANNRPRFIMAHSYPQNAIEVVAKEALPADEWSQLTLTYDGSSKASGIHLYRDGEEVELDVVHDYLYKGILYEYDIHTYGFSGLRFGFRDKIIPFKGGALDEIQVFERELAPLEVRYLFDPKWAQAALEGAQKRAWVRPLYLQQAHDAYLDQRTRLDSLRRQENELANRIPEIMVMGDLPEPRPTFVLKRGNYDDRGEEVAPGTPEAILAFDDDLPENRLGLAQWLMDPQHPLAARVIVNRVWQLHFGQGLVKTSEDLGNQGDLPSHPALLDWLAVWFVESGWDLKALHKLILSSATYQQQSNLTPELLEKDPENRLLARGPRFRLPAEMIRDNALAVSGLLVNDLGGPSVYPYQPEGLWDELTNKSWRYRYLQEPGPGLYRRSLYTIWKRTSPPPSMQIFDIADRDNCTVRRRPTNTPLQALVLLNDPQFQEAARVLAERLMHTTSSVDQQLSRAFRWLTGRAPEAREHQLLKEFYQEEYQRLRQSPQDAQAYLGVGEKPPEPGLEPVALAALGMVVNGIMNTEEACIIK